MCKATEKAQENSPSSARADKSMDNELLKVRSRVKWLGLRKGSQTQNESKTRETTNPFPHPNQVLPKCLVSRSQARGLWAAAPPQQVPCCPAESCTSWGQLSRWREKRQIVKGFGSCHRNFPAFQPRYTSGTVFCTGCKELSRTKDEAALLASTCLLQVLSLTPGGWDCRTSAASSSLRFSCSHMEWVWRSRSKMLSLLERLS